MTMKLCISATFLDSLYHGQGNHGPEWPPSPHRLYQALLAGAARAGQMNDDSFRWLESLEPPAIHAPEAELAVQRSIFVPNNDADANKKFERQNRLAEKRLSPTRMVNDNRTVHYVWNIAAEDETYAQNICEAARCMSALGWGIDLVAGDGRICKAAELSECSGVRWLPNDHGANTLRTPILGTLDDLSLVHESFLNRMSGKVFTQQRRPSVFREVQYASNQSPVRPVACFRLWDTAGEVELKGGFSQYRALHVANWVRHIACKEAKASDVDFPGGSSVFVAGHAHETADPSKTPQRFSYLPLPTIGHEHADGRIRRVMIAEPLGGNGRFVEWATRAMHAETLYEKKNGEQEARATLVNASRDSVFSHYQASSRKFVSVTPVILPGRDDRRYAKAAKLLLKAMAHVGMPPDEFLADFYLQKAPFAPGALHPREYKRTDYLRGLPGFHARLELKKELPGPLAIGAGRHLGLGLFIPESSDAR